MSLNSAVHNVLERFMLGNYFILSYLKCKQNPMSFYYSLYTHRDVERKGPGGANRGLAEVKA